MSVIYLILALLYVFSPYDVIPDIITGLGWLDDIIILFFLFRYLIKFKIKRECSSDNSNFKNSKNPFSVLGIEPYSSSYTIKLAYRKLANKYHPDKVAHLNDEYLKIAAEARFREIQEAYEQLKSMGKV